MNKGLINCTIIETERYKITKLFAKPIVVPDSKGARGIRGQAKEPEKSLYNSLRRAKKAVFEYVISNEWDMWGTLTFDGSKINRYDLDVIQQSITYYLRDVKKKHKGLRWLMVPEQHKDGAWHFHLLLAGLPESELRDTGRTYRRTGRKMYNWVGFEKKFGFNSLIDIRGLTLDESFKIANYLTKYMTKSLGILRRNKKKYWCSKGLKRPARINALISYDVYKDFFINDLVSNELSSSYIVSVREYYCKDVNTGEVLNTINEIVEVNTPF